MGKTGRCDACEIGSHYFCHSSRELASRITDDKYHLRMAGEAAGDLDCIILSKR